MNEQWKSIPQANGYEVSDLGRVRNLGGQQVAAGARGGTRVVPAKMLKPFIVKSTGYMQVLLPDGRKHSVHRLVASAFCDGQAPGLVVDHINNDRADNRASNLRWVEHKFNISRPYREDGRKSWCAGLTSENAPKITPIVGKRINDGLEKSWMCALDAVREFGFDSGSISKCCHGRQSSHKGWTFRFADGVSGFPWSRTSLGLDVPDEVVG